MNDALPRVADRDRRPAGGREGRPSPASSSPRRRRPSSPAATCNQLIQVTERERGRVRRGRHARSRPTSAGSRRSASRSSPRSTAPRSAAAWRSRSPATGASRSTTRRSQFGLPEVTLGLLPGAGGVTRIVRLLGIADGADEGAAAGHPVQAGRGARASGIVDELAATPEELLDKAARLDQGQPRADAAVGRQGLPDARRHARQPEGRRHAAGVPGQPAASSSRAPRCPRRTTSCAPRSRARASTSTPRSRSRAATSSTWPRASRRRT